MKNRIISGLRRIRDSRAKHYQYDIEAMARDLMKLDPWMEEENRRDAKRTNPSANVSSRDESAPTGCGKGRITKHK
jgi:hypothetical protein